jgi:hypothetical protein
MPASTVFWVLAPPAALLILTAIYFLGTREKGDRS